MAKPPFLFLISMAVLLSILFFIPSMAQPCNTADLSKTSNQIYTKCKTLATLDSYLYWNHDASTGDVHVAFRKKRPLKRSWVAWGLNPDGMFMAGLQALVALKKTDGSLKVYTSSVEGYSTSLEEGTLSFPVLNLSAIFTNNEIIMFARLRLNSTFMSTNQLWQEGISKNNAPQMHAFDSAHLSSVGTINFNL